MTHKDLLLGVGELDEVSEKNHPLLLKCLNDFKYLLVIVKKM